MNLIEKLGIEKCRAIVDGAPEDGTHFNKTDNKYGKQIKVISLGFAAVNYSLACLKSNKDEVIYLDDLRTAIAAYDYNRTDNLSHFTDNCTDIRNHISPNTKVIER